MSSETLRFEDLPPDYQEIERVLCEDNTHYTENYIYIKDKQGLIRPIGKLRRAQKKLFAVLKYCREKDIPARILVLKSRRLGISTASEADCYLETKKKGFDAIIIAQDKETSKFLLDMLKRFIELDPIDPPLLQHHNRKELRFKDRQGFIEIHTANEGASTRSRNPQYIHGSEVGHWEHGGQAGLALLNAIAEVPGTTLILESTANGEDGYFYPKWRAAEENSRLTFKEHLDGSIEVESFEVTNKRDWNGFIPLFISVLDDEDARRGFENEAERKWFENSLDAHEQKLIELHGVSLEFLAFRRWAIKNKCNDDEDLFNQEYPITSAMAFLASGRPRFNLRALMEMPVEDGVNGELVREDRWNRRIRFSPDKGGLLTIFEEPINGHRYVVGIDTAEGQLPEGSKKPDSSVIIVGDYDTRRQVATYCGQISEERLVEPALLIAEWYNGAYVVIEANSTGKHVAIEFRKKYPVERLYHRVDHDKRTRTRSRMVGWRTTSASRSILISRIANCIDERAFILVDQRTIDECRHFVWKDGGRVEAAAHWHDDHVFAYGLMLEGFATYPDRLLPLNREGSVFDEKFRRARVQQKNRQISRNQTSRWY